MIGHGRPSSLALALARIALLVCAVVVSSASGQETTPPNEPVRLQISWGGGTDANHWTGGISLDRGSLTDLKLLGLDADAAGSFWLERSQLRVATLSPHKFDSIELTANAALNAKLLVELSPGSNATPLKAEVPLADVLKRPYQLRLDDRGNTLDIRVVPISTLRISIKGESPSRETLIFRPAEKLSFELVAELPGYIGGTTLDVQTMVSHARGKQPLHIDKKRLPVPVDGQLNVDLDIPLPPSEGVYTVNVAVSRPSGYFRDKFLPGATTPLAERSFQVVLVDLRPPVRDANARWDSVLEIDPTNPRWFERLPSWTQVRFIPGLNHGPLGSIRAGTINLPMGRFIELPPNAAANPNWQAYSLPLEAVGVPHVLEIDYPADEEQHFGLSIVEPNAVGVVEGIHRDAGVYVEGLGRSEAKEKQTQRLIFWPRTQAPLLIITNQHPTAATRFGQIRVLKCTGALSAGLPTPPSRDRMVAAYLARPLAAETFGATEAAENRDVGIPRSVGDSQTAYETATRLADYLRFGGYNSAVVSVMADGSAIFPSSQRLLTPRYDSGRSADRFQNSDALGLALSVFDREELKLVPAIEFAAPLAELEHLRRGSDPRSTGLELIGPDGRTWLETHGTRSGLAPYYNLLEPHVQEQMLKIVGDVVERYGKHPAFGGLAIQLTGDGYAQLPGLEWGLDDSTIARFERDAGIQLNANNADKRFAARHMALTSPNSPHADAWRSWRAEQIANFYARLAAVVRGNSDRRLLLTTEKLFDHPQIAQRIRPNLPIEPIESRVASTMLNLGLDRQLLEKIPGVVVCPTRYVEPMSPLPERAIDLELNDAFARWRQQPNSTSLSAAGLYHRPLQWRLASFNANNSPFRMAGEMKLMSQPMPHGAAARQPYLQALLERDPAVLVDGGDLMPIGQEEMLRSVRAILAELPTTAQVSEVAKQPVTVRAYAEPNQVTFIIMNLSPWRANAQVTLDIPQVNVLQPLAAPADANLNPIKTLLLAAGRQPWEVSLEPYDLQAVRVAVKGAKAIDVQVTQSDDANKELKLRLADLSNRDLNAPREFPALANPSFEQLNGARQLLGWHLTNESVNATAVPDATGPQDGKACLYFRNAGQFAAVESDAFPTPATGQLAMTVFARGENFAPNTQLRLVFKAEQDGQHYRIASTALPGEDGNQQADQRGRYKAILVNDLPLKSNGQMRIIFELTGPGEVWLDNVKLNDLLFSLGFYKKSKSEILQLLRRTDDAQSAFDAGQISECLQVMDGYWPRFVRAYTPPVVPKVAAAPAAPQQPLPPQPNEGEQPAPGVGDRLKRIVPPFFR